MRAIAKQWLGHPAQSGKARDDRRSPAIVVPQASDGKNPGDVLRAKDHGGAGDEALPGQRNIVPATQPLLIARGKDEALPKPHAGRLSRLIDKKAVGEDSTRLGMLLQCLFTAAEPLWMPDIVLIAERNQSTAAGTNCLFEVEDGASPLRIPMDVHGKSGLRGEAYQQLHTVVRRAIVEDLHFIRQPRLRQDALQLRGQEAGSIVGAKRDGDAFSAGLVSAHAASLLSRTEAKFNAPRRSSAL